MKVGTLLVAIVLLVAVNPAYSGVISEIELGGGLNYGYLCYDDPLDLWDAGWGLGFTGGLFFDIPLSEQISFVPGLRFSSMKNKVELEGDGYEGDFKVNHKYISIPMLFRVELSERMFFIDAGPEFSFFISSEIQSDYTDSFDNVYDETDDIGDHVDSYNIGACVRVGFKMHRWDIPVAVSASYHHGFMGVADEDYWLSDWKTREFTFCVSYLFDLAE